MNGVLSQQYIRGSKDKFRHNFKQLGIVIELYHEALECIEKNGILS